MNRPLRKIAYVKPGGEDRMTALHKALALSLALTAGAAGAETIPDRVTWDGSSVSLALDGEGAVLTFVNRVSFSTSFGAITGVVGVGGIVVAYRIDGGDGWQPDFLTVIPPVGFRAEPAEILVEDGTDVEVLILPMLLG